MKRAEWMGCTQTCASTSLHIVAGLLHPRHVGRAAVLCAWMNAGSGSPGWTDRAYTCVLPDVKARTDTAVMHRVQKN